MGRKERRKEPRKEKKGSKFRLLEQTIKYLLINY